MLEYNPGSAFGYDEKVVSSTVEWRRRLIAEEKLAGRRDRLVTPRTLVACHVPRRDSQRKPSLSRSGECRWACTTRSLGNASINTFPTRKLRLSALARIRTSTSVISPHTSFDREVETRKTWFRRTVMRDFFVLRRHSYSFVWEMSYTIISTDRGIAFFFFSQNVYSCSKYLVHEKCISRSLGYM